MTPDINLDEVYAFAIQLAREAGQIIRNGSLEIWRNKASQVVDEKKNTVDLVTQYDKETERVVRQRIFSIYPTHKFIGEESYSGGERTRLDNSPSWIVDPIDGTTNFVHGFPMTCISIGFTLNKEPIIGVVYNPILDQLFSAKKGSGAWLNETQRLPLTYPTHAPFPSISKAIIGIEWGSDRSKEILSKKAELFRRLVASPDYEDGKMVHSVRSIGSAALNISYVAMGCLDAYWEAGCWAWDVTAAICILREAGGVVVNGVKQTDKFSLDLEGRRYLAIRGIEGGVKEQERIIDEFYDILPDIEYGLDI